MTIFNKITNDRTVSFGTSPYMNYVFMDGLMSEIVPLQSTDTRISNHLSSNIFSLQSSDTIISNHLSLTFDYTNANIFTLYKPLASAIQPFLSVYKGYENAEKSTRQGLTKYTETIIYYTSLTPLYSQGTGIIIEPITSLYGSMFKCLQPGTYLFSYNCTSVNLVDPQNPNSMWCWFRKNGVINVRFGIINKYINGGNDSICIGGSFIFHLLLNDYIELVLYTSYSGFTPYSASHFDYMNVYKLS